VAVGAVHFDSIIEVVNENVTALSGVVRVVRTCNALPSAFGGRSNTRRHADRGSREDTYYEIRGRVRNGSTSASTWDRSHSISNKKTLAVLLLVEIELISKI
jgi:hypothetical protein